MNLRRAALLLLSSLCGGLAMHAQADSNLVYNPSFEEHSACPQRIDALGIMHEVDAWWQPTLGSSDYFHLCGARDCTVPRNKMGYQQPHSGDAYCGIYCSQQDYREYLQTELRTPLQPGATYRVSFYVSLADKSPHAVATIGALLSTECLADSSRGIMLQREQSLPSERTRQSISTPLRPQVCNPIDMPLDDPKRWYLIEGTFRAEGGERFLTIGNFADFNRSGVVESNLPASILPGAYYYIDDVSVVLVNPSASDTVVPQPSMPDYDTLYILENLYFEVDGCAVLPQSYRSLRLLTDHLRLHPDLDVHLVGHTDSTGTVAHNQHLSEARAQSVAQFLLSHGIAKHRISTEGMGESAPLESNATAEGRRRNRRVEAHFRPHTH